MALENYTLYRIALYLITHLPRGFVYYAAGVLAELNFFLNSRSRRGVYTNQAMVLPQGTSRFQRWRAARASFRHFAYSVVDFFNIPRLSEENLHHYLAEIKGFEHVQAALASGCGGIFVTVHMGSWELGGVAMGLRGVPLTAAVLPHRDARIDAIFNNTRLAGNLEPVPVGGAMPKLENALTRGRFIALVSDRDVKGTGIRLPFFGQTTRVPSGHARLALRTGAWILPATTYRVRDFRIVIEVRPPIIPDPAVDTEESLTARCLAELEDLIRGHPEQWLSFFNLWSETELPVMEGGKISGRAQERT